jgi:3-hydroxyisobutyrate dehydrogenase-like beta-hydroxyacid dehydrogenase
LLSPQHFWSILKKLKEGIHLMEIKNISVIGLGLMGTPIATLLMKARYRVTGFDIIRKQMAGLVRFGLKTASSPKEASKGADLVILSLPNWNAVLEAVEGKDGVAAGAQKGLIVLDTSTSPPWESRALGEKLARQGIEWMDVPISGSSAQARMGNMVFMAGGKRSVFERIKPVLDRIGKKTVYAGNMGDGATLKLVINHTLYLNQAAAIEGLVLGMKAGLRSDVLFDVITSGAASSDLLISRGRDMLSGIFSPKGPVVIANKDLALSMETAKRLGVMLPVGALYQQLLLKAHYNGWDREDATAVMKIYEEMAGMARKGKRTPPRMKKK